MHSLYKLLKGCLTIAPFGGFAYYNQASCSTLPQVSLVQAPKLSDYFTRYVEQNNLVTPQLYEKFQKNYRFEHFFEKGLLQSLEGLSIYKLFMDKSSHDVLTEEVQVSAAERQRLLETAKLHCTFSANESIQSRAGMIHGGFTSTLFDNISGCLAFMACDYAPAVTAYLNVSYEAPMMVGKEYVAVVEVDRIEGRKVFLKGKVVDSENNVYTNMESLFIKPKWSNLYLNQVYKYFLQDKKSTKVAQKTKESGLGPVFRKGLALSWV